MVRALHTSFTDLAVLAASIALVTSLTSCNRAQNSAPQAIVQSTFASPADAGAALLDAAQSANQNKLLAVLGPDSQDVISSGDPVKDKNGLADFVSAYTQMHRWREIKSGGQMLYIGADNYLFPIPLGQNSSGQWYFDTAAGTNEILARRIGRDELAAIATCRAIVRAQDQYFNQAHDGQKLKQYAQKFVSDDGKQNGLYWPVQAEQPPSPLEDMRNLAEAKGYAGGNAQPFDGYYYRMLDKQGSKAKGGAKDYIADGKMTGGFAIVAYPAEYRNSGIMTFIVDKDSVVYQKDLGDKTADDAQAMTEYDPSDAWTPAM